MKGNENFSMNRTLKTNSPSLNHRTPNRRTWNNSRKNSSRGALPISLILVAAFTLLAGCTVGPKYSKPPVTTPPAFKESEGWKVAQPSDGVIKGKWWEMFNDAELNSLEEKVSISNQNVASSAAAYFAARDQVKEARSQLFPTVTVGPAIGNSRQPLSTNSTNSTNTSTTNSINTINSSFSLPFDATWQPDFWGKVRNTINAAAYGAQVSAADLENVRLAAQSQLAVDYFQLRGQDSLTKLLDSTVVAYRESLNLTKALYETGIDSDESVAQAETQLEATEALDTNLGIMRAQLEHAIALLIGQPASTFSIPVEPLKTVPPPIPIGVPSDLLERRPDVAASERSMAQANSQIGIATAAFYPTVTLSGAAGLESTSFTSWFTWPSRFWSVGAGLSETLFDAGLRKATVDQFRSQYNETVANYRQTVLTAFQQVEDNLAALRLLSVEVTQQDTAVASAQRGLTLATDRYRLGIDPYLNVITAQTTLLSNEQTATSLRTQQVTASVQLVQALGGGWNASQLPTPASMITKVP
jgi:NodT family efflux transporter outer membrane factor (OMF) lipoprotein